MILTNENDEELYINRIKKLVSNRVAKIGYSDSHEVLVIYIIITKTFSSGHGNRHWKSCRKGLR